MDSEPWYGVRFVYRLTDCSLPACEERASIVEAGGFDEAIDKAERYSMAYEDDTTINTDYALAFPIFDEKGPAPGEGVEVFFSLCIRRNHHVHFPSAG